jgi:hypothetical protein
MYFKPRHNNDLSGGYSESSTPEKEMDFSTAMYLKTILITFLSLKNSVLLLENHLLSS